MSDDVIVLFPCRWCRSTTGCDCVDRIQCPLVGTVMHYGCGWCDTHGAPRFQCLCDAPRKS